MLQEEVDGMIGKHKLPGIEAIAATLGCLTMENWETKFPLIQCALKETLRFTMAGTIVGKNINDKDSLLRDTSMVVPSDSLAASISRSTCKI